MTKDYTTIRTEKLTILGHKVKAVTEIFSDEYLNSNKFVPRCLRCCFYSGQPRYMGPPRICQYIKCNRYYSRNEQLHFELDE